MPKKSEFRATSTWGDLLKKSEYVAREEAGETYRVKPVDLRTFVLSHDYLGQDMWGISRVQEDFLKTGSDLENGINFFVLFVGKGGGKNWSSGVLFLYIVYKLLCMYDPHKYLNHNSAKAITLINVAINEMQARKNFFNPLINILRSAGDKAFKQFGFDPEADIQKMQVVFPKNIEIMSANSRAGGIEGYDLLVAMADEVDDVEFHSVDKIVGTLRTSSQSRFQGKEKVVVISYQRYVGSSGKINEFYVNAGNFSHVYARKYSSWEFHPEKKESDFETYFKENPEMAACVYGSVVSGSFVDSWIKEPQRIKNAMNWGRTWILDWPLPYDSYKIGSEEWKSQLTHKEWRRSPLSEHIYTKGHRKHQLDPYNLPIAKLGDPNQIYIFCGDPALGSEVNGGDGYGIALAHREIVSDDRNRRYVRPIIDLAFRFTGRMFDEGQVQMVAVEKFITSLKDLHGYNIKYFSFDGWNSASLTQWITKTYRNAVVRDFNLVETKDYTALRDAIFGEVPPANGKGEKESNGGIDLPWHPILYEELRELREDRSKNPAKVDHPTGGGKDIADVVAKAVYTLTYAWPFTDIISVGIPDREDELASKVRTGVATDDEKQKYMEEVYSETIGLGSWKKMHVKDTINLYDIFPKI